MKTVIKDFWFAELSSGNITGSFIEEEGYTKGSLSYEVEEYTITLRPSTYKDGSTYYHMLDLNQKRLPWPEFMSLLSNVKRIIRDEFDSSLSRLTYNIYSGQPVWEFNLSFKELTQIINEIDERITTIKGESL